MAKIVLVGLVLSCILPLVLVCEISNKERGRSRRQARAGLPLHTAIPVSVPFYPSPDQQVDSCPRGEVELAGGACHKLLTQGPCKITEVLLLDRETNQGYCAPRLCAPDRIFVFSDQLCHDPRNTNLCPPGRQLYESAFGTPVCQCPDGTYEINNNSYDTVCEPILGMTSVCPPGQVLWFRDFSLPPECLPDPCGGKNLYRGPNDLPFIPSASDYGKCYQLGQMSGVCPAQTWYSLALERLQGVCSSLQDAGYQVFDPETLAIINYMYGPPIPREDTVPVSSPAVPYKMMGISTSSYGPTTASSVPTSMYGDTRGSKQAFDSSSGLVYDTKSQSRSSTNVVKGELIAYLRGLMESGSGADRGLHSLQAPIGHKFHQFFKIVKAIMSDLLSGRGHHRTRRAPLPHATPGNVFETRLVGCRAGAQRDINAKCRDTVLPSRPPFDRVTRAAPPVPPQPGCPGAGAYNLQRSCTSPTNAINSINAFNLG